MFVMFVTFVQVSTMICEQGAVRRQVSVPAPPLKRPSCQTGALDYHYLQANATKRNSMKGAACTTIQLD